MFSLVTAQLDLCTITAWCVQTSVFLCVWAYWQNSVLRSGSGLSWDSHKSIAIFLCVYMEGSFPSIFIILIHIPERCVFKSGFVYKWKSPSHFACYSNFSGNFLNRSSWAVVQRAWCTLDETVNIMGREDMMVEGHWWRRGERNVHNCILVLMRAFFFFFLITDLWNHFTSGGCTPDPPPELFPIDPTRGLSVAPPGPPLLYLSKLLSKMNEISG